MVNSEEFKAAVGKYPTGVCVISTKHDGNFFGFTANSFTSVSLEPALISFCLNIKSGSFKAFMESHHFVVNILSSDQTDIARHFSSHVENKFQKIKFIQNEFGTPLIDGSLSIIECKKGDAIECGDHYIFIGKVLRVTVNNDSTPLLYYAKSYRELK